MININPRSGLMRGVRLWADPDGILLSPFDEMGQKMGYVLVYGEDSPAVFDGKEWHSVLDSEQDWSSMHELIADQYYKIIEHASKNPEYAQLAQHITGGVAV
jgi:hypothetical protein